MISELFLLNRCAMAPLTMLTFLMETVPPGELTHSARCLPLSYRVDGSQEPQEDGLAVLRAKLGALQPGAVVLLEEPERHYRRIIDVAECTLEHALAGIQILFATRTNEFLEAMIIVIEDRKDPPYPLQTIELVSAFVDGGRFIGREVRHLCRDIDDHA